MTLLFSCVLVYDSVGEPVRQSVRGSACEQSTSSSDFEVGGATSGKNFPRRASRKLRWRLWLEVSSNLA